MLSLISINQRAKSGWKAFVVFMIMATVLTGLAISWHDGFWSAYLNGLRHHNLVQEQQSVLNEVSELWKHANLYPSTSEERWRELQRQVEEKTAPLRGDCEEFLRKNPLHYRAMTSYAVFLENIGYGDEARVWRAYAFNIMPHYAPLLNDMANSLARRGQPLFAIQLYEAAVHLEPGEAVYHFNLGNMYYLFREETRRLHGWKLKGLFANALGEFRLAREQDRSNFVYAICYAETFYNLNFPLRNQLWREAMAAWDHCLEMKLAPDQRDFVQMHMVRVSAYLQDPVAAMNHLSQIRNVAHRRLASRLLQKAFPDSFGGLLHI